MALLFIEVKVHFKYSCEFFDSTLIQGYEGRILRIILKATNLLDIPKDSAVYEQLVSIDYSGEKDVLIQFIV